MKIKISYPNDYGSDESYAAAVEDCCGGDSESEGCEDSLFEAMADAAKESGLQFVRQTDFGAIWRGTADQCAKAKEMIPGWASTYDLEEIEE